MELHDSANTSGNSRWTVLGRVFGGVLILAVAVTLSYVFKGYRQGRDQRSHILAKAREAKAAKAAEREAGEEIEPGEMPGDTKE